ncbi:MAG: PstS family phosphate ABC transporter substrate-binding protein [Pseudomonadota bacterium]
MTKLSYALLAAISSTFFLGAPANARDRIQITGSSTVFPFTTTVAERFGQKSGKTPIVESTGTGGGLKLFCAGVGEATPDIANASRRIKKSEFDDCTKNGATPIEVKIGFDGIVVAGSKQNKLKGLTLEQVYLALASEVPGKDGKLTKNTSKTWADVSPDLPAVQIRVLGPPPTSGTRDSFNELALLAGCETAQKRLGVKIDKEQCQRVRDDGPYVESGENDNIIVQKLSGDENALGVFGYSFLEENQDKIEGLAINGVEDTAASISNGKYPLSRSLYIYVKKEHVGVTPGLEDFIKEYTSEAALGEDGYLAEKGLIPLPEMERKTVASEAAKLTTLTGQGL